MDNGACSTKSSTPTSCASYTTENDCNAVTTCEWSNNACSLQLLRVMVFLV